MELSDDPTLLLPDFILYEELGCGENTRVIAAKRKSPGTPLDGQSVAIKELLQRGREDPGLRQRFAQEAYSLMELHHPRIARLYEFRETLGLMIMERFDGSLADLLRRKGTVSFDVAKVILIQLLQGLHFIHAQGRVHWAIQPGSILYREQAGQVSEVKLSGAVWSPESEIPAPRENKYLAPELYDEDRYGKPGAAVDLYLLGFTIVELLLGENLIGHLGPVVHEAPRPDLGWAQLHGDPEECIPLVQQMLPETPRDLARVVDRLLQKRVADRYASAEEALQDLGAPLTPIPDLDNARAPSGPPISTDRSTRPERISSSTRTWILIAVGTVLLGLGLLLLWLIIPVPEPGIEVTLDSTPPGATVVFGKGDNKRAMEKPTPLTVLMKPGKHTVRLEVEGYEALETVLEVPADSDPLTKTYTLEKTAPIPIPAPTPVPTPTPPALVRVSFATNPTGARVMLAGEMRGVTPLELELKPGTYPVVLSHPDCLSSEKTLEVKENSSQKFQADLEMYPARRIVWLVGADRPVASQPLFAGAVADAVGLQRAFEIDSAVIAKSWIPGEGGSEPTAENLRKALSRQETECRTQDTWMICLFGPILGAGESPALATSDGSLPIPAVLDSLAKSRAGSCVLLLDGCRNPRTLAFAQVEALPRSNKVALVLSGMADELSQPDLGEPNGVFGRSLARGLRGMADQNADGQITLAEWVTFTSQDMKTRLGETGRKKQTPRVFGEGATPVLTVPNGLRQLVRFQGVVDQALQFSRGEGPPPAKADLIQAEMALTEALPSLDKVAEIWRSRATVRMVLGDFATARVDATRAVNLAEKDPGIRMLLGDIERDSGNRTGALEHHTQTLKLTPNSPVLLNARAECLYLEGKFRLALDDLDLALAGQPEYPRALVNRALVYLSLRSELALPLADCRSAQKLCENDRTYHTLGLIHLLQNERPEAITAFQEATRIAPEKAVYWHDLGKALYLTGKNAEAEENFTRAGKLLAPGTPLLPRILVDRARSRTAQRKWDEAVADCTEAIQLDSKLATAYVNRALAMEGKATMTTGDDEKKMLLQRAAQDRKQAAALAPGT